MTLELNRPLRSRWNWRAPLVSVVIMMTALVGIAQTDAPKASISVPEKNLAGTPSADNGAKHPGIKGQMRSVTNLERKAAAERIKAIRAAEAEKSGSGFKPLTGSAAFAPNVHAMLIAPADLYFGPYPNYANSPTNMRKFVDSLPGLTAAGVNNLGNYIPLAVADTATFPGSDFYRIGLRDYYHQFHSALPGTLTRGYFDLGNAGDSANHYLGPLILATKNRAVRVLFRNMLPIGSGGNLFIPADTTMMGAGAGSNPDGTITGNYTQNRATIHLHGGNTPWISDGTPHTWITPFGESTSPFTKGESFQNVPDMVGPGKPIPSPSPTDGAATYYWTNQQGGRLMFYHDHAYGITRLNVYAGEAAGYLLVDPAAESLLRTATIPGTIPDTTNLATADLSHVLLLVIQDKAFVDATKIGAQDPTWQWGSNLGAFVTGGLWFPHVYMTNQWPDAPDLSGANPMGRWDYGPWFFPPVNASSLAHPPIPCPTVASPTQMCPGIPNPTLVPEAFVDTPVINGTAYPYQVIAPAVYRFHILNAANDRAWNLQFYYAATATGSVCKNGAVADLSLCTEVSMVAAVPHNTTTTPPLCTVATTVGGQLPGAGLDGSGNPINGTGLPATCWPTTWPTDGRDGGVPDPLTAGPPIIQIGSEGGPLPLPAVIPSTPMGYEYNRRSITVLNVFIHGLFLMPAERADAVVDFSSVPANSALILYSDAPAPVPAFDSRNDYYTSDPDQTSIGGAPTTLPGYGPNTRTIMQFRVTGTNPNTTPFSLATLSAYLPWVFGGYQPVPIVPEPTYPTPSGGNAAVATYSRIQDTQITYTPVGAGSPVTTPMQPKAIQELFELDYGRMNATLGVELPLVNFLTQTTIPYGYIDPPTELLKDGEVQIWKITHNGVDSHPVHFHLFNVELVNRVGWDGAIKPPDANELGWKETVRMNPLEDVIVALKPMRQTLPWPLPNSVRRLDVTRQVGSTTGFTAVDPQNNPVTTVNDIVNFGNEYVWHCHILGHEENDFMRGMSFGVPPDTPVLSVTGGGPTEVNLSWTLTSINQTGFTGQRATDAAFSLNVQTAQLAKTATSFNDTGLTAGTTYYYRLMASNLVGDTQTYPPPAVGFPTRSMDSAWSATVSATPAVGACFSLTTAASPVAGGTIVMPAANCVGGSGYFSGALITLIANAAPGYTFTGWTGTGGTFSNATSTSTVFTITAAARVTAHFAPAGAFAGSARMDIAGRDSGSGNWWVAVSHGTGFTNEFWGSWATSVTWANVVKGDFNGDGKVDLAGRDPATGNWWVAVSNGSSFTTSLWSTWPSASGAHVVVGDFNGDGKADIAGFDPATGNWEVALSTGTAFTSSVWGTWSPSITWTDFVAGDFAGDGKVALAARDSATSYWWVAKSTGTGFASPVVWAQWNPSVMWVDVRVGDFNGDGKVDLAGRDPATGNWWVAVSNGSSFTPSLWSTWPAASWAHVVVGDFNGDGKLDLAGFDPATGNWWVAVSNGSSFTSSLWTTWPAASWAYVVVGDFNGDGKVDLAGFDPATGNWWVAVSNGSSFTNSLWTNWLPLVTWVDVM